ncbi:MAG: hypothetical protein OWQ51_02395 [Pyrobaculum arsenaticum]|uniref:hypothetical protein n=1 Tax=Pyrobaculum TaxID=2276 RepID=UPI002275CB19|nr:hypothetical protein [Pyrobaculum arsenaticum]
MKAKLLGTILLMAALAILAISVAASRAGGAAFNTTFMYKNGVLEVVGPDGQPHALKLEMKGGGLKAVEIRLLPNGTLLLLDHGKVWAKAAKTAGQISGTASATTAEKRPDLTKAQQPISGTLEPYSAHLYGPYTGLINIELNVSWSPAGYLCLGYVDLDTGNGPGVCYYGGSASASFPLNPSQRVDAVVANINSYTVSYSGTLTLYYQ